MSFPLQSDNLALLSAEVPHCTGGGKVVMHNISPRAFIKYQGTGYPYRLSEGSL